MQELGKSHPEGENVNDIDEQPPRLVTAEDARKLEVLSCTRVHTRAGYNQ